MKQHHNNQKYGGWSNWRHWSVEEILFIFIYHLAYLTSLSFSLPCVKKTIVTCTYSIYIHCTNSCVHHHPLLNKIYNPSIMKFTGVLFIEEIGGYWIPNRQVPLRFLCFALFNTLWQRRVLCSWHTGAGTQVPASNNHPGSNYVNNLFKVFIANLYLVFTIS